MSAMVCHPTVVTCNDRAVTRSTAGGAADDGMVELLEVGSGPATAPELAGVLDAEAAGMDGVVRSRSCARSEPLGAQSVTAGSVT